MSPERCAANDLWRYAELLESVSITVRALKYHVALGWFQDWRMYGFERNLTRWPNGKFYLIDRNYGFWRGHRIGVTAAQVAAFKYEEWGRLRLNAHISVHKEGWDGPYAFAVMESDEFPAMAKRYLRSYVDLLFRIAEAAP